MKIPFIIIAILMIVVIRHVIVILHELSHALPALWLTGEKVTVYLGSYGDDEKSKSFTIGKIEFKCNWKMMWNKGLCRLSATNVLPKHIIIYTLAGPIIPFFIGCLLFATALSRDFGANAMLFSFLFFVIGLIDIFANLVPMHKQIALNNVNVAYNDGLVIKAQWQILKYGSDYHEAVKFFNQKEYKAAAELFQRLPKKALHKPNVFRLLISSQLLGRDFENALENLYTLQKRKIAQPDDYCNIGYALGELGDHNTEYYKKALRINPGHKYSLNNLGYVAVLNGEYDEAIVWANKAIAVDDRFSHPYCNRGAAKIKLGQIESGLEDTRKAIELDTTNAFPYKTLGIYHLDQGNKAEALENFKKAKELNAFTHEIDELLEKAENV